MKEKNKMAVRGTRKNHQKVDKLSDKFKETKL